MKYLLNMRSMLALVAVTFALSNPGSTAFAAEVNGIKFDDTAKVGGKDLKLNGAGMRVKAAFFKLYVAGLYLGEKKSTPADIIALAGPKRVQLVMLREISSEDFGDAFMKGLNENSDKAEKSKFVNQTVAMGEIFASIAGLKKGDVLHLDWIPNVGMQSVLNGKQVGQTVPDVGFYNAVLRIWLGDKPVDSSLKPQLLGEAK